MIRRILSLFLLLTSAITALVSAQDAPTRELVLVPVSGSITVVGGAMGSRWLAEQFIRNTGNEPVGIASYSCPLGFCGREIPANTSQRQDSLQSSYLLFELYCSSAPGCSVDTSAVRFSTVVRDLSRQTESWGIEVHGVRESELQSEKVELMRVPTDVAYRRHLRIYGVWTTRTTEKATVRVRVFDVAADLQSREALLAERIVELDPQVGNVPQFVGFASIGNLDDLLAAPAPSGAIRVVVERISGSAKLWAFATLTNNTTQYVTTVTP